MRWPDGPFPWWLGAVGAVFLALSVALVVGSLDRPSPTTYVPEAGPIEASGPSGVRTVTLDARSSDRWVRFDLAAGRIVGPETGRWDLAVRRFNVVVNGGAGLPGEAAVAPTGDTALAAVHRPPDEDWRTTRADADGELRHPLLEAWYKYDFFSHLLRARPQVWAIRSASGELYKLQFLSYYCPGPEGGCVTFRYAPLQARSGSGRITRGPETADTGTGSP